ncbi:MAG: hypothetical protein ACRDA3_02425 [Peptostreptococcaceae bacterium]
MLKKFFNRLIKNPDIKADKDKNEEIDELKSKEICITNEGIISEDEVQVEAKIENNNEIEVTEPQAEEKELDHIELEALNENYIEQDSENLINENAHNNENIPIENEKIIEEDDKDYINAIKIKRGKSIKAIDVYTEKEIIFKTHKECSKKIKVPLDYIIENLKYGYTDYLGDAINYLSKELQLSEDYNYLESSKSPIEIFNNLHNKIFSNRVSEKRRDEILSSERIEPIKMHYKFECIDEEYDEYFEKYKAIIKRGGKKKIELVDKKGEAIEIFKSLDECADFLGKEKDEVVEMLKCMNNKVGRYEIRYSLRNI